MIAEGDVTRYVGDALALVATNHRETLNEVLSLIDVDYTVYEPITDPQKALLEDAPLIHEGGNILRREVLKRGDADKVIPGIQIQYRGYSTPFRTCLSGPECAHRMPTGRTGCYLHRLAVGLRRTAQIDKLQLWG